jgi:protein-tyrosine phosphatase
MNATFIEASEIAPGLWQGSFPLPGHFLRRAGFHTLVLAACDHQPGAHLFPGLEVARIRLQDDGSPVPHAQFLEACRLASHLARCIKRGENVLVTCRHGRNRSGLVSALTLVALTGSSGRRAAEIVQERRNSPYGPALTNSAFVRTLKQIPGRAPRTIVTATARAEAGV